MRKEPDIENNYYMSEAQRTERPTGTEKIEIRKTPGLVTTSEISSYHNPASRISEKYAIETREQMRQSSNRQRQRQNRERSEEERKLSNLAYQDQLAVYEKTHQSAMNSSTHNERVALSNVSNTLRQPSSSELGPNQYSKKTEKVETKGDQVITEQRLYFFDPTTGHEENQVLKTRVKDPRLQNQPIKKQTYEHQIKGTPNGPEEDIKVTHRDGSVMDNIKNKLTNILNHGF